MNGSSQAEGKVADNENLVRTLPPLHEPESRPGSKETPTKRRTTSMERQQAIQRNRKRQRKQADIDPDSSTADTRHPSSVPVDPATLLERALVLLPALTAHGVGNKYPHQPCLEEISVCVLWIQELIPTRATGSYGLKHVVEQWSLKGTGHYQYISNGALIAAAVGLGNPFLPNEWTSCPNLVFPFALRLDPTGLPTEMGPPAVPPMFRLADADDLVQITNQLQKEKDDTGEGFLGNISSITSGCSEGLLYMIQECGTAVQERDGSAQSLGTGGFVLFSGPPIHLSPEILNVWSCLRRQGIGRKAVRAIEHVMQGRVVHVHVAGPEGCHAFWESVGYKVDASSRSTKVIAIQQ
jgi:hypothetical protein